MSEPTTTAEQLKRLLVDVGAKLEEQERSATRCPGCGSGLVWPGEQVCGDCDASERRQRQEQAWRERQRQERIDHLVRESNLPRSDIDAIVDGELKATAALKHVQRWYEGNRAILVLCGGVGIGKSVAAAWAASQDMSPIIAAQELPQRTDPWGDEAERFATVNPKTGGLVVLDDLGTESENSRWVQVFGYFMDCRYAHGRTVITTNLRRADIRGRYGDRVAERLNHVAVSVEVGGESMRKQGSI